MGFFRNIVDKFKQGLQKTREAVVTGVQGLRNILTGRKLDEELINEIERRLLQADVGVKTTAKLIDEEIRRIIDTAEKTARKILTDNIEDLHRIARALLDHESLSGDEVKALLRGEGVKRTVVDDAPTVKPGSDDPGSRSPIPPTVGPLPQPGA